MKNEIKLSPTIMGIVEKRYLAKDETGKIAENVSDMFYRVAKSIAEADKEYGKNQKQVEALTDRFFNLMTNFEFMPNSPTLMNAGRPLGQLSACFVLPVEDSMEGIFNSLKNMAIVHKSGGGTGFGFGRLRPKDSIVSTTGGQASGPLSFMQIFDSATESIKQGGARRGANMGVLPVWHPDVEDFIEIKANKDKMQNFNLSVAIDAHFMECVEKDLSYNLHFEGKVYKTISAKKLWNRMMELAHKAAEPGIIFIDRINDKNPVPHIGDVESTNPCGEQPLLPYESCNLGSINLGKVVDLNAETKKYEIDYNKLRLIVHDAVHFLDNVITANKYPIKEIEEMTKKTRKIGLGIMGFADLCAFMGVQYGSDESIELAENVMKFINDESHNASEELGKSRGSYPTFEGSIHQKQGYKYMRNATTTTIAPTGTISLICGASGGIEPYFMNVYKRLIDNEYKIISNPILDQILADKYKYTEKQIKEINIRLADGEDIDNVLPHEIAKCFVTTLSNKITPEHHVRILAAFQNHTDNAVSKTVNMPNDSTVSDVHDVYWLAYKLNCKGVTVYRDGSIDSQVLNKIEKKDEKKDEKVEEKIIDKTSHIHNFGSIKPIGRPKTAMGITTEEAPGCNPNATMYININVDENGRPIELFCSSNGGGCKANIETIGRLCSVALRSGTDPKEVIKQLKKVECKAAIMNKETLGKSCADAIGRVFEKFMQNLESNKGLFVSNYKNEHACKKDKGQHEEYNYYCKEVCENKCDQTMSLKEEIEEEINTGFKCPNCGETDPNKKIPESGCWSCANCGYSKCS